MARTAWVLRDLAAATPTEYRWEINPKEMSTGYKKNLSYQPTAAPGGRVLAFEGRDEARMISYSGTVLSQEQFDEMIFWFQKRYQLQLEDDLGMLYSVYIVSLNYSREGKTRQYPWRHSYTGEMLILDWVS